MWVTHDTVCCVTPNYAPTTFSLLRAEETAPVCVCVWTLIMHSHNNSVNCTNIHVQNSWWQECYTKYPIFLPSFSTTYDRECGTFTSSTDLLLTSTQILSEGPLRAFFISFNFDFVQSPATFRSGLLAFLGFLYKSKKRQRTNTSIKSVKWPHKRSNIAEYFYQQPYHYLYTL